MTAQLERIPAVYPKRPDLPRRRQLVDREQVVDIGACLVASAALAGTLRQVLDWHGLMSTGVWWYVLFLVTFYLVQRKEETREIAADRIVSALIWSVGVLVVAVLSWMLTFLAIRGYHKLSGGFFTHDMGSSRWVWPRSWSSPWPS